MKRTGKPNINFKSYWNDIYRSGKYYDNPTNRFVTALKQVKSGNKVLDIGCGMGVFTELVKDTYPTCEVWGVDISDSVIEANRQKHSDITYQTGRVGQLTAIPANYFDLVFSGEVLEHLDEPEKLFLDAYSALKPGGKFVLTTPNGNSIPSEEHVWEFIHEDIEDLYHSYGFPVVKFKYLDDLEHLLVIMAVGKKQ
jgi:ubiquinone/menaquinone biosynthesis C-methylase UbiE